MTKEELLELILSLHESEALLISDNAYVRGLRDGHEIAIDAVLALIEDAWS